MLMQQDQYKFVLCTYNPRDSQPRETLPLDDFNVDYLNDEEGKPLAKCSVFKKIFSGVYHTDLHCVVSLLIFWLHTDTV